MDEELISRVALWVIARFVCVVCWLRGCGRIPLAVGLNWRRRRWVTSSCPLWVDCWRCVCLLCGGPNPLTRGLTALRWCLCVSEGWCGVAGQYEGLGGAFPARRLFLPCVFVLLVAFPLSSSPPVFLRGVAACSRAMLIVSAS
ncbi:retrotransposon hot spot (RHS) protein [Trypanosoma cruzi]|nr:retrotransposon hot spot (RHS) protein [Trypanosoma cruzi]